MFSHIMVGSNDVARSRTFYDALLGAIGGKPGVQDAKGRLIYSHAGGRFLVTPPINGEPDQADAWHKAGMENGGTAIEDAPGVRESPFGGLYLAYLRDPDGNKLCALHRMAG
jgi:catechol 2,3-dioxygenase-like lactoylglutathione lyase family enzyme